MFRIVTKKYLDSLHEEIRNLKTEIIAVYGEKGYGKARPCQLCLKRLGLTEHHLVPRKQRSEAAKQLALEKDISVGKALIEIRLRKIKICRHCHNLLHKNYTDQELAESGGTFNDVVMLYNLVAKKDRQV